MKKRLRIGSPIVCADTRRKGHVMQLHTSGAAWCWIDGKKTFVRRFLAPNAWSKKE